jgi:hypothetical protein
VFRRLLVILLFLGVWFVGDRAAARVIGAILDWSRDPIAELYAGRGGAGAVLLGNSRAYRHFDLQVLSREFGVRVANLSLPGASGALSEALFADYLDRYGPPRIAIVELSNLAADTGALKNLRPFVGSSERLSKLLKEQFPTLYYAGRFSHLFNYNSEFSVAVAYRIFRPMPDLVLDGLSRRQTADLEIQGRYFAPHDRQIAAIRRLVQMARSRNIDVRLVLSPAEPTFAAANQIGALRRAIRTIADGLPIWDCVDDPPLDRGMFVDPSHLNRQGVAFFMNSLRDKGFFHVAGGLGDHEAGRCP